MESISICTAKQVFEMLPIGSASKTEMVWPKHFLFLIITEVAQAASQAHRHLSPQRPLENKCKHRNSQLKAFIRGLPKTK